MVFFVQNGIYENIQTKKDIDDFISRGVFEFEETNTETIRYYIVPRETTLDISRPSLVHKTNEDMIGSPGDICIKRGSPFPDYPLIHEMITYFWGGHSGLIYDKEGNNIGDDSIESLGNADDAEDNGVQVWANTWAEEESEIIGLRLRDATMNDYEKIVDEAEKLIGAPYNYTFILNRNKSYYCSDVINKAINNYGHGFSVNDGFVITLNDMVLAEDTYIFYYHYYDDENVKHVYYIGE